MNRAATRPIRRRRLNAATATISTLRRMARGSANHRDLRRRLTPRDYIPMGFGVVAWAPWRIPVGGDPVSAAVARVQHELVLRYREARSHGSGRQAARAFGISESVWTRALAGEQFMGETVMAALLHVIHG